MISPEFIQSSFDQSQIFTAVDRNAARPSLPIGQILLDRNRFFDRVTHEPFYHVYGPQDGDPLRMLYDPLSYMNIRRDEINIGLQSAVVVMRNDADDTTIDVTAGPGEIFTTFAALQPQPHIFTQEPTMFTIFHGKLNLQAFNEMGINPKDYIFHGAMMFNGLTLFNILNILYYAAEPAVPGCGLWYHVNIGKTGSKPGNLPKSTGLHLSCPLLVDKSLLAHQPIGSINVFANADDQDSTEAQTLRDIIGSNPKYKDGTEKTFFETPDWAPNKDELENEFLRQNARAWFLQDGSMMGSLLSGKKFIGRMLELKTAKTQTYRGVLGVQVFKMI